MKRVDLPVRKGTCRLPSTHDGGVETDDQRRAVEQHVETIGDETEAVSPRSVQQLHKRKTLQHRLGDTISTSMHRCSRQLDC